MDMKDALIITGLGIGVVFSGLILTNLTILLITNFSRWAHWGKREPEGPSALRRPADPAGEEKTASPEQLAVIAAILEVESRLRKSIADTRFTFRGSGR